MNTGVLVFKMANRVASASDGDAITVAEAALLGLRPVPAAAKATQYRVAFHPLEDGREEVVHYLGDKSFEYRKRVAA